MARSRGSRGSRTIRSDAKRDDPIRSLERSALPSLPSRWVPAEPLADLREVEDFREWHPDPDHGAVTLGGNWARVVVHPRPFVARSKPIYAWRGLPVGLQPPVGLKFESPLKVVTCVRRKVRREVIHALAKLRKKKKPGRGGAKHRRTWRSEIKC